MINRCIKILRASVIIFAMLIPISLYAEEGPGALIGKYVGFIIDGDFDSAESCWSDISIMHTERLGISYKGIGAKYDCDSPLMTMSGNIIEGRISYHISGEIIFDNIAIVPLTFCTAGDTLKYNYYLSKERGKWKIAPPHLIYTKGWMTQSTKYASIHYANAALFNSIAAAELDNFIEDIGGKLNISEARMKDLSESKIEYYLCNEEEMEKLSGYKAQGMTKLPFDAVLSRHLPHFHEITHLMINYSAGELPLYTLPCFQEGLAVYLGGRWGKSPEVLFQMGNLILSNAYLEIDEILTYDGFHRKIGNPDMTYPVSALFVKYLADNYGFDNLRKLYFRFSGDQDEVNRFTFQEIKSEVEKICGKPWFAIRNGIIESAEKYKVSGITPGIGTAPSAMFTHSLFEDGIGVKIFPGGAQYSFDVFFMDDEEKEGVVLIESCFEEVGKEYRSWMFTEQNINKEYLGEKYGIHFSRQEAGLYNYFTNVLEAKYVYSFFPDKMYFDAEQKNLHFTIDNEFFEGDSLKFELVSKKRN